MYTARGKGIGPRENGSSGADFLDHRHSLGLNRLDYGVGGGRQEAINVARPRYRLDLVPRSPLYSVQMPAKANSGRSPLSANQTTSFFLVTGFVSGAYSAELLAGTRHRFSGLSQPRQCGDDVFLMLVTGKPPARGGAACPSAPWSAPALRTTGAG
jgi:hypothetical protein